MKVQIKHTWTNDFLYEAEVADDDPQPIRTAVEKAAAARANLACADFAYANLAYANLACADFAYANLAYAKLACANLANAKLAYANLAYANLTNANLTNANLTYANLTNANLAYANLAYANLTNANLAYANLAYADLACANLAYAKLACANLANAKLACAKNASLAQAVTEILPREGEVVGWKKCRDGVLVKLRVPPNAKRSNATGRKCRASRVEVLEVVGADRGVSMYVESVVYVAGQSVAAYEWDANRWNECSGGIHFFLTREEAEVFEL